MPGDRAGGVPESGHGDDVGERGGRNEAWGSFKGNSQSAGGGREGQKA